MAGRRGGGASGMLLIQAPDLPALEANMKDAIATYLQATVFPGT